jgi:hypothetical protein
MDLTDDEIGGLGDMLNGLLEYGNQDGSFTIRGVENDKLVVEFNIVRVEEDNYIGFAGY